MFIYACKLVLIKVMFYFYEKFTCFWSKKGRIKEFHRRQLWSRVSRKTRKCPSGIVHNDFWKILRKDLGLQAYKILLVQELKSNDY